MNLYTFKARTLSEALRLVRQELGPDASVLHTRQVGSAVAQLLGAPAIEVTASAQLEAPSRLPAPFKRRTRSETDTSGSCVPAAELLDFRGQLRQNLVVREKAEGSLVERLAAQRPEEGRRLRGSAIGTTAKFPALARQLERAGVSRPTIDRWLERLAAELACDPECDAHSTWDRLRHLVASELAVCGPFQTVSPTPAIIALVGPTGVGKTTTVAKLAAHFRLHEHKRVGLITVDTYRIAAAQQLRAYAEIMDLPMQVVANREEMTAAVGWFRQHDVLFIDTGGTSPRDTNRIAQLHDLLAAAPPRETALVLSLSADAASLKSAATAMAKLNPTSLILTKIDEAAKLGPLADALAACELPVSYLTHGQNVPADIEPASALRLAGLILAGTDGEMARWRDGETAR